MNKEDILKYASPDVLSLNPELTGERETYTVGEKMAKNKFNAKKTKVDGIQFDSQREASRYIKLKAMEDRGDIWDLELQPKFELQPEFTNTWGERVRAITYSADFMYKTSFEQSNEIYAVIEDVKGSKATQTQAFRLRWKMIKYAYRDNPFYKFVIVS